ncbi:PASTA domain-containing protein [Rathayibacter oskolensis]|uniref:PASTA domain-containing protein n=1 Tax=Rathayibacter oskolensis TaxID=1891671 RepID=UPI0034662688
MTAIDSRYGGSDFSAADPVMIAAPQVTVPDVTGRSVDSATQALLAAGFSVGATSQVDLDAAAGDRGRHRARRGLEGRQGLADRRPAEHRHRAGTGPGSRTGASRRLDRDSVRAGRRPRGGDRTRPVPRRSGGGCGSGSACPREPRR